MHIFFFNNFTLPLNIQRISVSGGYYIVAHTRAELRCSKEIKRIIGYLVFIARARMRCHKTHRKTCVRFTRKRIAIIAMPRRRASCLTKIYTKNISCRTEDFFFCRGLFCVVAKYLRCTKCKT